MVDFNPNDIPQMSFSYQEAKEHWESEDFSQYKLSEGHIKTLDGVIAKNIEDWGYLSQSTFMLSVIKAHLVKALEAQRKDG